MTDSTPEHSRPHNLHVIADNITTVFESEGVIDVTQINAFIDQSLLDLCAKSGVQVYSGMHNPTAIPELSEGVRVVEPGISAFEDDQATEIMLTFTETKIRMVQTNNHV